jgi:hypothetical protein
MIKRGILAVTLILMLSGCGLLVDKPKVIGLERLTLKVTESVPYIFQIENPKTKFTSKTFSNFQVELGANKYVRLNYAGFSKDNITDEETVTINMHMTALEKGTTTLYFIIYYDEEGKTKSMTLKVPTKILGPGIDVEIEEKPILGKTRMRINETRVFHATITNSIDTRYRNGRLRVQPLYGWIKLKELEGYDAFMDGSSLVIETDLPTAKTIPFMIKAVPEAIEAAFSVDVIVEYSSNQTEWAELARQTVEMYAED